MIFASGIGLALYLCINYHNRIDNLSQMLRILNLMSAKIRFDEANLVEISQSLASQSPDYNLFFSTLSKKMQSTQKMPFDMIWKYSVDECLLDTSLTKEDKVMLKNFGTNLGNTDKQLQIGMIDDYCNIVRKKIDELKGVSQTTTKLYLSFGILGSLFIIIVLY